ncbi:MAG: DNA mismatch repair endonuclease MutL [Acidobacteria bacterium]|nr:DNA mismatch repair endonuclease MutL [Acidobacteriota bacterium]
MGLIRILPDNVANKIAAGEVVERPASVVKELLENSLDAGAGRMRMEVDAGGKRLIRVADDGVGMLRDDALLAFERHATSKLREVGDLLSIATLGFRGEALPSIASVSRLQLETRSAREQTGTRVEIAGGKLLKVEEVASAPGAILTVQDLFFNVPARRKFLRSEQTELAHIASLVTHYSLAHPDKSFLLTTPRGELLNVTPVETLRERVFQVFGAEILEDLVALGNCEKQIQVGPSWTPPVEAVAAAQTEPEEPEQKPFRLTGFVSRPQVQKLNRNSIYIFVNRRLIRDRLLLHALSSAYHNLLPAGCYPFALLFLEIPFDEVDVNVHPSKTEVRFRHQSFVHDFVRDAVRERLVETKPVATFPVSPPVRAPSGPQPAGPQPAVSVPYSEASLLLMESDAALPLSDFALRPNVPPPGRFDFSSAPPIEVEAPPAAPAVAPQAAVESLASLGELQPLGQVKDSFIVAAGADGLWIIDQHVAHERILFEKILRQRSKGAVERQRLLMPMVVRLTAGQQINFPRLAEELNAAGFELEPFGHQTIAVKAAPAGLANDQIEKLLTEILDTPETELRNLSTADLQAKVAASIACHAAIKINTPLDPRKMQWLLEELGKTDCPMSCPHGRPIVLRYSMKEILKAFHRI